jgi:hypothetical protein
MVHLRNKSSGEQMTFSEKVKKGLVAHPTQVKFKVEDWLLAFKVVVDPSDEDLDLLYTGIWAYRKLDTIRNCLQKIDLTSLVKREKLLRLLVGSVNRTSHIISGSHLNFGENSVFAEQMIQGKFVNNAYGVDYTPDEILTGSIDGIRFPIRHALRIKDVGEDKYHSDMNILGNLQAMIDFGNYYSDIESIWLEALWNGWKISHIDENDIVLPSEKDIQKKITDYRRQSLLLQLFMFGHASWEKMPPEMKIMAATRPHVVIEGSGKRKRYKLTKTSSIDTPPMTFIAKVAANEFYFTDVLDSPLPNYNSRSINELLTAWEVLYSLVEGLKVKFPTSTEVSSVGKMCEFSPKLETKKLVPLIQDALGISSSEASDVLQLFILQGNEEIWFRPLVPLDADHVLPVIAPIHVPNLLRLVEHWMKEGGFAMASRGDIFEEHVRTEIAEAINHNKILNRCKVILKSSIIQPIGEQIDLIVLLGNKILIGEVKCGVYPASALEFYNYYQDLEIAATQSVRKANTFKDNISLIANDIGIEFSPNDNYQLIPVIVTNQAFFWF